MDKATIDAEHDRLGYSASWRFIVCREANLRTARLAIITLNPGGTKPRHPCWSQELGPSFIVEEWGDPPCAAGTDPLQVQLKRLCAAFGEDPEDVFIAQFVPFRSRRWADLKRKGEALALSAPSPGSAHVR